MAENENSEFETFKAARTANDEAGAVAAIADTEERIPLEEQTDEHGANPVERQLRERFEEEHKSQVEEEKAEGEEKPEEKSEEKQPEEKRRGKHDPKTRIEKLTKEKYDARTEAEQARAEAAELRARVEALEKDRKSPDALKTDRASTSEEVKAARYQDHVARLRVADKDYDQALKAIETLPTGVRDVVRQMDNAARIEHFLAKSPEARKDLEGRTLEEAQVIVRDMNDYLDAQDKTHTGLTPQVEHARAIEAVVGPMENAKDVEVILKNTPEYGAYLMGLKKDEAIAAVRELSTNLKTVRAIADAIKDEGENGKKVYAHFQEHPEEFEKIGKMPPIKAAREVTRLAVSLEAPREKSRSRAPEPIKPLSASPSRSGVEGREDMSLSEWKKYREAGGGR